MEALDIIRMAMAAEINEAPVPEGKTWTTAQLTEEFNVLGFMAPFVVVVRKSDGKRGTLEFKHSPRTYFNWREE